MSDAVWNPDELEDGRTRPEDNFQNGASYTITAAALGTNPFGDDALVMSVENDEGEEFDFSVKLSKRSDSKWGQWVSAWRDLGVELSGPDSLVGISFVAEKLIDKRLFNDDNNPGQKVEREVHTVLPSSISGGGGSNGSSAEAEEVIEAFLDAADGLAYGPILTKVQADDAFKDIRKKISDRSLLNKLVEDGRLVMDGRTYRKA